MHINQFRHIKSVSNPSLLSLKPCFSAYLAATCHMLALSTFVVFVLPLPAQAEHSAAAKIKQTTLLTVKAPDNQWQTKSPKALYKTSPQTNKPTNLAQNQSQLKLKPNLQKQPKTKTPVQVQVQVQVQSKPQVSHVQINREKTLSDAALNTNSSIITKNQVQVFVSQANKLLEQKDITGYANLISDDALLTSVVNMLGESFSSVLTKPQYIEETQEGLKSTSSYDYRVRIDSITILPKLANPAKNSSLTKESAEITQAPEKVNQISKTASSGAAIQAVVKSTVTEKVTIAGKRYASSAKESAVVERVGGKLMFTKIDAEVFLTPLTTL